jgi:hypothetical protein
MHRAVGVAALLSLSGCHGCAPDEGAAPFVDAAPARGEGSRVFLVRHGAGLRPLGCYDGRARKLRKGAECRLWRVRDLATALDAGAAAEAAVATQARHAVRRAHAGHPAERGHPDRRHFTAVAFTRTPPMWLHTKLLTDLDGDGRRETLLAIKLPPWTDEQFGPEELTSELPGEMALLFLERQGRFEHVPLDDNALYDAWPLATFDLDGDGRTELWMENHYYEGYDQMIVRWTGSGWEVIDELGDGT